MLAAVYYYSNPGFVVINLAVIVFGIFIAVDASKYPDWAFERAGTKKWLYQILTPIAGFLCAIVAIVFGIIWLASKKAQVAGAAGSGPSGGSYGPPPGPPPGSWSPPPPPPPGSPS